MNNVKTWLFVIVAAIILIVVMYYFGKKVGKAQPPKPLDIPNDGNTGNTEYKNLIDAIYNDIEGVTATTEYLLYWKLNELGDGDLVKAINYWNSKYYKQNNEKLFTAIDNEYWVNPANWTLKTTLLNRIKTLGG